MQANLSLDRRFFLFAVLAAMSLLNIMPMIIFPVGGDILSHYVYIDCFSNQFWQGDLYPRWCFNGNTGLGAPFFFLYSPLPYYVAALLYPLQSLGVSLYGIFVLSCLLATLVTAISCFSWLKDMVTPRVALFGTLCFLFTTYRMEVLLYRTAYAELWQIAWLPLLCKCTRRLARRETGAVWPLAAAFGLSFLSHVPCSLIAAMMNGLYLLVMTGRSWRPLWRYGMSLLLGLALAAFYLVPGRYYQSFLNTVNINPPDLVWPNLCPTLDRIKKLGLWQPAGMMIVSIVMAIALAGYMSLRRRRIEDGFIRRELVAWMALAAAALFLLLPVSAPVYDLFFPLSEIVFPWRMQIVFALAITYMAAVWMQWLVSERRRKTLRMDMSVAAGFLILIAYSQVTIYDERNAALFRMTVAADYNVGAHYRTLWTDTAHFNSGYMVKRYNERQSIPKTVVMSGKGSADVRRWAWDGIELQTQSAGAMTVRLDHIYFPIWRVQMDGGTLLPLRPEDHTGQMLIDIPAGAHAVTLTEDIAYGNPYVAFGSLWLSVLAWLVVGLSLVRKKL